MSTYEPVFDAALLQVPWHPLPSPSRLILKHAQHPSRPGYVMLLTDLSSMYCEVLTGPGVPARMTDVDRAFHANGRKKGKGKGRELAEDDIIGRCEAALKGVGELWTELGDAKVEMKNHDYHDAVLSIGTDDFSWLFYLTELKGRQPLEILSKHLIAPLAGILLETNNVKTEGKNGPMELVHTLFEQSPTITQHMTHHDSSPSTTTSASKRKAVSPPPSASKSSSVRPTRSPEKLKNLPPPTQEAEQEEEDEQEYASDEDMEAPPAQSPSRNTPSKPVSRSKSSAKSTSPAPVPRKTPTRKARHVIESDTEAEAEIEPDAGDVDEEEGAAAAEGSAEKSVSPPPPTASSQAAKKERERLEEEEMKSRAEAMKRKMEGGGVGGGNLGRRRLRR